VEKVGSGVGAARMAADNNAVAVVEERMFGTNSRNSGNMQVERRLANWDHY